MYTTYFIGLVKQYKTQQINYIMAAENSLLYM